MTKLRGYRHQGKTYSRIILVLSMLLAVTVFLLMLLGLGTRSLPVDSKEDSLPIKDDVRPTRVMLDK